MKCSLVIVLALQCVLILSANLEKRKKLDVKRKMISCKRLKCPVGEPICAKMSGNATKDAFIILLNKCELDYMKCRGNTIAAVSMKFCDPNEKLSQDPGLKLRTSNQARKQNKTRRKKLNLPLKNKKSYNRFLKHRDSFVLKTAKAEKDSEYKETDKEDSPENVNVGLSERSKEDIMSDDKFKTDRSGPDIENFKDKFEPSEKDLDSLEHDTDNSDGHNSNVNILLVSENANSGDSKNDIDNNGDLETDKEDSPENEELGVSERSKEDIVSGDKFKTDRSEPDIENFKDEPSEKDFDSLEHDSDNSDLQNSDVILIVPENANSGDSKNDIDNNGDTINSKKEIGNQEGDLSDAKNAIANNGDNTKSDNENSIKEPAEVKEEDDDNGNVSDDQKPKKTAGIEYADDLVVNTKESKKVYEVMKEDVGFPVDYDLKAANEGVDFVEYNKECPTICPAREVMVCAKCKDGVYRTFMSLCHLRMFNCNNPDEKVELVSRYPCVLSAPYLAEAPAPKGRVSERGDRDLVLQYIRCKENDNLGKDDDPRCKFRSEKSRKHHT